MHLSLSSQNININPLLPLLLFDDHFINFFPLLLFHPLIHHSFHLFLFVYHFINFLFSSFSLHSSFFSSYSLSWSIYQRSFPLLLFHPLIHYSFQRFSLLINLSLSPFSSSSLRSFDLFLFVYHVTCLSFPLLLFTPLSEVITHPEVLNIRLNFEIRYRQKLKVKPTVKFCHLFLSSAIFMNSHSKYGWVFGRKSQAYRAKTWEKAFLITA